MKLSPLLLLGGIGMILIGIIAIAYGLSTGAAWSIILWGALAWIVSVGLKVAWAVPTNKSIIKFLKKRFSKTISGPVIWAYIGLLTGIFECGITLLFALYISSIRNADWANMLGFGISFGGSEAIILGIGTFTGMLSYMLRKKPPRKKEAKPLEAAVKYPYTAILAPIAERIATIPMHAFTAVLVVLSVQQNNYWLFWLAFAFKSLIDAIAAWIILKKNIKHWKTPWQIWSVELIFALLGIISILGIALIPYFIS